MQIPRRTIPFRRTGRPGTTHGKVYPIDDVELDYTVIQGNRPGRCLLITAGVHGSEVCGIETARRCMHISPNDLEGTLVIMPVLNPRGLRSHSIFTMPDDGKNLNRAFPGSPYGSTSDRLAYWLVTEIYPHVDAYIDLHSADATEALTPFTVCLEDDSRAQRLAVEFGLPITMRVGDGRYTINGAATAGVPGIIVENGEGGRWSGDEVAVNLQGIKRVMKHLGMIPQSERANNPPMTNHHHSPLIARANSYTAPLSGYWRPTKTPGGAVQTGDQLGQIEDVHGAVLHTFTSAFNGVYLYGSTALWLAESEVAACVAVKIERK
jgi:predicted deacylase